MINGKKYNLISSFVAWKSGRILLEAAPLYLDLAKVKEDLIAVRANSPLSFLYISHSQL